MEYISRDLAKGKFTGMHGEECSDTTICKLLDDIPAADVQPVVHAQWNQMRGSYRRYCSNCEYDGAEWVKFFRYCPQCGAKMSEDNAGLDEQKKPDGAYYDLLYEEGGMGETRG